MISRSEPQIHVGGSNGPPTRTDWAEQVLREEILRGTLKPGEHIKIRDLVERYPGLSATPLREALSRLSGSGLVEFVPQRGPRVAPASNDDLHDVYEVRALLETLALRRSLAAQDEEWFKRLKTAFADFHSASVRLMKAGTEQSIVGLAEWEKTHRALHYALVSNCGSPWLLRFISTTYEQSAKYRSYTFAKFPQMDVVKEHKRILDAVYRGDAENATSILEGHTKITVDSLSDMFPEEGPP